MQPASNGFIVLLSGPVAAGKTTLADDLTAAGFKRLSTRDAILRRMPSTPFSRDALQQAGEQLDATTHGEWVAEEVDDFAVQTKGPGRIVVDAVRIIEQISAVRSRAAVPVLHVHVNAAADVLRDRYESKRGQLLELADYSHLRANPTEAQVGRLAEVADLIIDTGTISRSHALGLVRQLMRQSPRGKPTN
jgi:adenylate kinase family enzyme